MKGLTHSLATGLAIALMAAAPISALAKGGGGGAVTSGWSVSSSHTSASGLASMAGISVSGSTTTSNGSPPNQVQGYNELNNLNANSMGGMLITPNGMIAHNMPAESVNTVGDLAGSSEVSTPSRGIGNSQVGGRALGIGNSQGAGGTVAIAQMTHFGISGLAYVSSILGASGVDVTSVVDRFLNNSTGGGSAPGSGASASGSGGTGPIAAIKSQVFGQTTTKACVSTSGGKSGCD